MILAPTPYEEHLLAPVMGVALHMGPPSIHQMQVQGLVAPLATCGSPFAGPALRSALGSVEAVVGDHLLLRIDPVHPVLR